MAELHGTKHVLSSLYSILVTLLFLLQFNGWAGVNRSFLQRCDLALLNLENARWDITAPEDPSLWTRFIGNPNDLTFAGPLLNTMEQLLRKQLPKIGYELMAPTLEKLAVLQRGEGDYPTFQEVVITVPFLFTASKVDRAPLRNFPLWILSENPKILFLPFFRANSQLEILHLWCDFIHPVWISTRWKYIHEDINDPGDIASHDLDHSDFALKEDQEYQAALLQPDPDLALKALRNKRHRYFVKLLKVASWQEEQVGNAIINIAYHRWHEGGVPPGSGRSGRLYRTMPLEEAELRRALRVARDDEHFASIDLKSYSDEEIVQAARVFVREMIGSRAFEE